MIKIIDEHRLQYIKARLHAAAESTPVHRLCLGAAEPLKGGSWYCHGCDSAVPLDEVLTETNWQRAYSDDVLALLCDLLGCTIRDILDERGGTC